MYDGRRNKNTRSRAERNAIHKRYNECPEGSKKEHDSKTDLCLRGKDVQIEFSSL